MFLMCSKSKPILAGINGSASIPKPALLPCSAHRREMLETIAFILRGGALSDPFEDLAALVASVEVVEGLQRAGFTVVRTAPTAADAMP